MNPSGGVSSVIPVETDAATIAYCAGIIDGEGYLGIKKQKPRPDGKSPTFHARVTVRMVQREAVDFLADALGGKVKPHAASVPNGRPLVSWNVTDAQAERVIRTVLPYLRVKRRNAEAVLELRDLQAEGAKHRTKIVGYRNFPNAFGTARQVATRAYSDEFVAMCDELWQRCKDLNARGLDRGEVVL